jgi:parallel beta-helix repeat protein
VFTLRATGGQPYTCRFVGLTIRRGRYGIQAQDTETGGGRTGSKMALDVSGCVFIHNGYDGIPYVAPGSTVGSDYTVHATDGGAIRGEGDDSRVVDCQIEGNDRGIQFDFGQRLQITGNQISGNAQAGIQLGRRRAQGAAPAVADVTVRGNRIRENYDAGIRISGALRATVEANSIERNWNSGVVAFDSDGLTIRQNRIFENSLLDINGIGSFTPDAFGGVGIVEPLGPTVIANNDIRANHTGLLSHTAGGIRVQKSLAGALTVTGNNLFANDGDGVAIEGNGANVRINGNNITSNRGFGVNNQSGATVAAENNWWASATGPRTGPATADNPEQMSGRLVVRPWATAPFTLPAILVSPVP